ncbi:hypothetical protein JKP88DRAFT_195576 [Tribonema minus]|uniref:Ankyrin repeat domain-containing protein n=1 Tax=Tribonema minus TaxID=303371 RepID=A0A835ZG28_9STRA|nr:hypothetical protein JKP88DRAFT_195576 [Tribonema minus]
MGTAVRNGSVQELLRLVEEEGRTLSACNKFGESLAHLACRKGSADVVATILRHGGSLTRCDDLGRVPAHDTCWESRPRWDIVQLHLEADAALLLTRDARGWTPLRYVKRANWAAWRAFLDAVKDRYWPARGGDGTCDCT